MRILHNSLFQYAGCPVLEALRGRVLGFISHAQVGRSAHKFKLPQSPGHPTGDLAPLGSSQRIVRLYDQDNVRRRQM